MNSISSKIKVAIIGLGKIGEAIATNLTKGGHAVILSSRDDKKSRALASKLGTLATAMNTTLAINDADVIIPAIYFDSLKEFFRKYTTELKGKIIVDVSNPIGPDGNGGFKKIVGQHESAGKILSELIPKDAKLIKAFGTLGVGSLIKDAFQSPERKVLFYASDSTNSNDQIEGLIKDAGFEPLNIGGIDQSIRIEVFGDLHEFGALGKAVILSEAKKLLS